MVYDIKVLTHTYYSKKTVKTLTQINIMEVRVYLIDLHQAIGNFIPTTLSQEEFITIAEEQGTVYSLDGFSKAYNTNQLDGLFIHSVIRFY